MTPTTPPHSPRNRVPGDDDYRVVLCEACCSEGRLYRSTGMSDNYGNEMLWEEECGCCEGTGGELVPVEPIEAEEFTEAFGP